MALLLLTTTTTFLLTLLCFSTTNSSLFLPLQVSCRKLRNVAMGLNQNGLTVIIVALLVALFFEIDLIYAVESDINCLKSIKASLEDPFNNLKSSWNFNNNTEGRICSFAGIDCWHPDESRVLNLRLSGKGLGGEFPQGIADCTTMSGLDLSGNNLRGPIPSNISRIVEFLTLLDLSGNDFSGKIPVSISNISFLNVLNLNNNKLSGQIPGELGQLARLKTFSVANNRLSGPVPRFVNGSITARSYANNLELCGGPLPLCRAVKKDTHMGLILGGYWWRDTWRVGDFCLYVVLREGLINLNCP